MEESLEKNVTMHCRKCVKTGHNAATYKEMTEHQKSGQPKKNKQPVRIHTACILNVLHVVSNQFNFYLYKVSRRKQQAKVV